MLNLKRTGSAIALVLGSAVPSLAQTTPENVVVAIEGSGTAYRVPIAVAAELCGEVPAETLAAIVTDADVIYCTVADEVPFIERNLINEDGETTLERVDDYDDDEERAGEDNGPDGQGTDQDDDGADSMPDDSEADGGGNAGTDDQDGGMTDGSEDTSGDDTSGDDMSGDDDASNDDSGSDDVSDDDAADGEPDADEAADDGDTVSDEDPDTGTDENADN